MRSSSGRNGWGRVMRRETFRPSSIWAESRDNSGRCSRRCAAGLPGVVYRSVGWPIRPAHTEGVREQDPQRRDDKNETQQNTHALLLRC